MQAFFQIGRVRVMNMIYFPIEYIARSCSWRQLYIAEDRANTPYKRRKKCTLVAYGGGCKQDDDSHDTWVLFFFFQNFHFPLTKPWKCRRMHIRASKPYGFWGALRGPQTPCRKGSAPAALRSQALPAQVRRSLTWASKFQNSVGY